MLELKETGDWEKASVIFKAVANRKINKSVIDEMNNQAKRIKKRIVQQIDSQNFIKTPRALSPITIRLKGNDLFYVDTRSLRNGIEIKHPRHGASYYTVGVTASNNKTNNKGVKLNDVLKFLEYGTSKNEARPILKPTWEEMEKSVRSALRVRFRNSLSGHGKQYDAYRGLGDGSGY